MKLKQMRVYKSAVSLITATSFLLMSGCTGNSNQTEKEIVKEDESCKHLTVCFGGEPVTFKECDGYEIGYNYDVYSGVFRYSVYKNDTKLLNGQTQQYNIYFVDHNIADDEFNVEAIQKVKK